MKTKHVSIAVALMLVMAASSAMAQGNPCNPCSKGMHHFHIEDPMNRNSVTFRSEAPLEDIVGTTSQITGHLMFDPAHPDKGGSGELSIPVASLNTGIPLRDEHVRSSDWLNADKYPHIKLQIKELKSITKVKATADYQTYDVTVVGELSFHGKTNMVNIPGRLTYLKQNEQTQAKMAGNLLAARASFEIPLADYGVTGPKGSGLIGSNVGESIAIDVSIMGSDTMGTMAGAADNPCGGKAMNPCNPCGGKKPMASPANPCNPCSK